ncbi:hypothetical protein AGOR_G00082040 [Albula goreensis]|uniref:MAX gene-associated protein-like n=1 Tax=Albula goreensis TaxID=1534307 RepID=A0A8T3DN90_9TELE|nr:hypothetical protein AGOR_G00082040 [Albula goreensis]
MASVESRAVMKHEEEEEFDVVEKGETVPSAAPSLLTTTSPTLFFILKPGQAIQGGKEQGILVANQENNLVSASAPSVDPEGPTREAIPLPGVLPADSICKGVKVTLHNNHMWNEFHCFKTEMILTKQGRRMFPYCSFSISGLDPLKRYILVMDIAPVDNIRWKWNGHEWEAGGRAEPHVLGRVFIHPESPSLGQYWTQNTVSFYKLKLTNNTQDQEGYMILHSMHRYLPRLHLVPAELATDVIQLNGPDVMTFTFPQTEFFAVTAYQNMRITQLKIYYNPFAKGFREEGQGSQISKPALDPSEPLFCPPPELNGSSNKLRHLHKTLQSLIGPREDIEGMESQHSQTAGHGAALINGMQNESEIRGEKHPCPVSGKESKLKMRKCNAKAQDSVHVEEELGIASEEPQLDNQSSVAGEPMWSKQGGGNLMLVEPSSEQSTTLHVHAPVRPSGITQLSPVSSGKRKRKPKARHSGKRRKLMSKAGLDAMKVAERPVEAALLPDLEDVEGLLFVSFVSKDAMDVHLKDPLHHKQSLPPQETMESPEINEIVETLEDRIVRLQDVLVLDLQRFKHRQVIHPVLQEVGLKLSLLDPALVIDLGYLGVRLPLPPPVLSPVGKGGTTGHIPSADGAHFVSRTGKTKDFTKIKGWREKFVPTEASSLKCADTGTDADRDTDLSAEAGLRNRSAFCSDMLDAYLEKESRQMDVSATLAFSSATAPPNSTPIVLYQLPTKSSSYVRPLQSVLNKQAPKLTLSTPHPHPLKPPGVHTKSKSKSKPKSKPVQVPRPTLSTVKHPTPVSAKPAAKIQAATKKELAPWLSIPAPRTPPGNAKPEVRLSRVQLKLMHMEMGAVWKGKSPTHITKERAELALAALVTAQGTLKGRSFNTKPTPHLCPPCGQVFCRLGCVCASLARERQVPTHCRKPACMFGCSCLKRKVVLIKPSQKKQPKPTKGDVIAQEIPVEGILSKSQPDQGDIITKEASVEDPMSKCKSGQGNLTAKESSLEGKPDQGDVIVEETSAEEKNTKKKKKKKKKKRKKERMSYTMSEPEVELEMEPAVHMYRLWNRQKEEVDPEPLYIPKPQLTPIRPYVPRPNPVVREEDKDPVYRYFESMMTCARVREYANKPLAERPLCSCTSVLCSGKICDHYYNPNLLPKEKKDGKTKAKPKPHVAREEPRQVLEIMSEFDWEPERDRVLTVLCQRMASRELSQPFHIGPYHIQPSEPFLRMDGQVCCTVIKVRITRPPGLTSEETPAKSLPPVHPKAVDWDGAKSSLPAWPCTVHPGLLTARKKQPGVPAKGLIKVNGKSYSQAKLQLGQMGALHPSSRLAAYIAGRLKPTSRNGSVLASLIFKSDGYAQSKGNVTHCVTTATTSITTATAGISGQVPAASSIVKPLELSVQQTAPKDKPPSTHLLLVPVQAPGHTSATPPPAGTLLPLTAGQSVVLQPVHSASGARLFCQPNGQLVHLLPFNQLRHVPPHLRAKSPGAVGPRSQPQPLAPVCDSSSGLQNKSPTTAMLGPSLLPALTESPVCITTTAPLSHSAHQSETAESHSTPATKPVPSFLGHSGTYRFRIGPSTASRVEHSASPPVTPTGFTPLHVPLVLTSEPSQKEKDPTEGPTPLLSPDPGFQDLAETESRDSSDTYDSNGEQQSHEASPTPAATPVVTSHRASKAACAVRTLAQSNSGMQWESPLSEDSEEDSEDETNDADTVDVETVEELSGKVGNTPMKAGAVEKNLKEVGLIHQANRQAELEARVLLSQDEVDTARQSHNMSEHQRRCKLRDKFLSLQQVLGLQPSARLSRFHILRQACAEIQALVDQCNHLEEKKRRMTQMRGIYIRKISQSSGKTEELIRQKLQEICAKQKSLEAQRKKGGSRVGLQPALEPNRSKSPLTPVSAETKVCVLPKIIDVRSLVTSPLKTTGTAELEKQCISEAAKTTDKSFAQAKDCGTVPQEGLPAPFQNEIFLVAQPPMPGSQEKGGASSQEEEEEEGGGQADPDDAAH